MGRAKAKITIAELQKKNISSPADIFLHEGGSRAARWGVAVLATAAIFVTLNGGYVWREFEYSVARLGASVTGSTVVLLAPEEKEAPLQPNEILIPSIGVRAPIVYVDVISEPVFVEALHHGVVHYPMTANVGEPGNAFLFGHSSDWIGVEDPYRNVFALLPHLLVGDEITVTDQDGLTFTYVVTETFIVTPTDTRVLEQGDGTESILTLQTSYPFGTALARFIVRATLKM